MRACVRPRPRKKPGRALISGAMTWVWSALIVVGVVMVVLALWPRGRDRSAATPGEGDGADRPDNQ
jgi:hypothetical protein